VYFWRVWGKTEGEWKRGEKRKERTYVHVMENGIAKRDKVAMGRIEDV